MNFTTTKTITVDIPVSVRYHDERTKSEGAVVFLGDWPWQSVGVDEDINTARDRVVEKVQRALNAYDGPKAWDATSILIALALAGKRLEVPTDEIMANPSLI
jgi:hypothetical protein